MNGARFIQLAALLTFVSWSKAVPICKNQPNVHTQEYTYHICRDTGKRSFDEAREMCKNDFNGSDLVVFPNKDEFNFLIKQLKAYKDPELKFILGFYQNQSNDRWSPQTGDFYWINSNERLTNESDTYWQPFSLWITNFSSIQPPSERQFAYYLMDSCGVVSPGIRFNGGILPKKTADPYVVCMEKGVKKTATSGLRNLKSAGLPLWAIILIVVVVVALAAVVLIIVRLRVRSKSRR